VKIHPNRHIIEIWNTVLRRRFLFVEGADMIAWDSIAAHERGLEAFVKIIGLSGKKTNKRA
jgi:hypothetical protein